MGPVLSPMFWLQDLTLCQVGEHSEPFRKPAGWAPGRTGSAVHYVQWRSLSERGGNQALNDCVALFP